MASVPVPSPTPEADARQKQIVSLMKEIERLAVSGLRPQEFFPQFLRHLLEAISASAGCIWLIENSRLRLCAESRYATTGFQDHGPIQKFNQQLLSKVTANCQSQLKHTDDEQDCSFPSRHLLILTAIQQGGKCVGVVEIFQRPDVAASSRPGYLQFVEQMTAYASRYVEHQQVPPGTAEAGGFDEDLARFGLQLQRSLCVNEVAQVAVNDGRLLVRCDRASIVMQKRGRPCTAAVSGQESIHHRSNLVTSMNRLGREVIRSGVALKYVGMTDDFAPQVKDRLADFVQESGARLVYVIPLRESRPLLGTEPKDHRGVAASKVFGCLVIEQFHQSEPTTALTQKLDWFVQYSAAALSNARTHESLFLLPVWSALGRTAEWFHGQKLLKTLAVLAVVTGICYVMAFVNADFRIEGKGRLMPIQRREIFASYDGDVIDVLVSSGERVTAGQLLVKLRNNELQTETIAVESQREEKLKQLAGLQAERDEAIKSPTRDRSHRVEGDIAKTNAELQGLDRRLKMLQDRKQLLEVRSPIEGVVSTFEVDQLLRHRPVRRGEILLEVMDDKGPWELELNVAQHRMGHLALAQSEISKSLPIEYLLVTAPEQTYQATLREVGTRVVPSDDNRPVVELLATPEMDEQLTRRIGAEVRARLYCGRKPLGYVLFGDVVEFAQRYLWL
ncbi:MAG TPA: HlyD family efflux transporter periplasmic adaptor subunit [Schlesneria sp.]|jgi:hypothetical protein